jgi:hypothetical protein
VQRRGQHQGHADPVDVLAHGVGGHDHVGDGVGQGTVVAYRAAEHEGHATLHAIATGNLLPATVETFCVDINQAVVTKLADRGSHQALGIVTDVGPFLRDLVEELARG